jgi:TorA maturation chaperone TorD
VQYASTDPDQAFSGNDDADNRLCFYRFLSTLFSQPLEKENIEQLFHQDYIAAFRASFTDLNDTPAFNAWISFIQNHFQQDTDSLYQMLALEFTRLFRGLYSHSGPRPPYEAVYVSEHPEMALPILRQVSQFYKKLGLIFHLKERADFIGLEMDLMRYLVEEERKARETENHDEMMKYLVLEQEWLQDHMLRWIPMFCEELHNHASIDFYKSITAIASQYLHDDLRYLEHEISRHLHSKHSNQN